MGDAQRTENEVGGAGEGNAAGDLQSDTGEQKQSGKRYHQDRNRPGVKRPIESRDGEHPLPFSAGDQASPLDRTIRPFSQRYETFSTASLIKVARMKHLVDEPSEARKLHARSVPTIGGIIIFASIIFSYALYFPTHWSLKFTDVDQARDVFKSFRDATTEKAVMKPRRSMD